MIMISIGVYHGTPGRHYSIECCTKF